MDLKMIYHLLRITKNSFDVIIDDGGHRMTQQINTLTILFPKVLHSGGIYATEDI